jgi:hypothetical protein
MRGPYYIALYSQTTKMATTKKKTVSDKPKVKGLFDHINSIYTDQSVDYWKKITESDRKTFSTYMVNRFISMNEDYTPLVNEYQLYGLQNDSRITYLFYSQMIPKGRQFNKYIKATDSDKFEEWLIDLVRKHFEISSKEAIEYIKLYYHTNATALRTICERYGTDPKLLKKAGL